MFFIAEQAHSISIGMVGFCFMTTTKACQYADGMGQYAEWAGMVGFCFKTTTNAYEGKGVSG